MSNEVFPVNKHLLPINVNSMAQFNIAIEIINKELNKNISSKEFDRDFHIATDQLFCFLENNGIDTQLIAKTINKKLDECLLSKDDINIYFNDYRYCNFCWSVIYELEKKELNRRLGLEEPDVLLPDRVCNQLKIILSGQLSTYGSNIEQRRNDLINCIQQSYSNLNEKIEVIRFLNELWENSLGRKIDLDWIDKKNIHDCKWCYEYMINSNIITESFKPMEQDYFWALAAAIDIASDANDLELLIIKMKKAFSQRKYREKNHELKTYSIGMNQSTKKKLDELVKSKKMRIHEVIEDLINNEHMYHFKK